MSVDLTNPIFHDETAAREHLEALLWPHGEVCPHCGVIGQATLMKGKTTRPGLYKCRACRKPFTVTMGTVMERSKIPLAKWVLAAQLMASSKKSMAAHQLHRMLGTNYETAWFLFHRLREAAGGVDTSRPLGGKNEVIETDETYIGGKARNKAFGSVPKKVAVLTMVERDGRARSRRVADVTAKTLRDVIVRNADRASWLMTDESPVYPKIGDEFAGHGTVNHSKDEYSRMGSFITTNSAESFFALLKRAVYGQFHHISEAHMHRYLAEADFKYNHRTKLGYGDEERASLLLRGTQGKRLMYRQPSGAGHA